MKLQFGELNDQVYEALEHMIISGELKPGERIRQEKVSEELGVSRISLLKALQRLEDALLVEKRPRSGIFVRQVETKELLDAFESRVSIECVAARLAAQRVTSKQVTALRRLFSRFKSDPDQCDRKAFILADREFHKTIIHLSGNPLLRKMDIVTNLLFLMSPHFDWSLQETLEEHENIIDALQQHDSHRAELLMKEHIMHNTVKVAEAMEEADA